MSKRMTKDDLPKTLGAFKPVGHVMVAVPGDRDIETARKAFTDHGFADHDLLYFGPGESGQSMQGMIEHASEAAGFGYEITLMRRYLDLSRQGCHWLLVYAPKDEAAEQAKAAALEIGAPMAVKYHRLAVEDLI